MVGRKCKVCDDAESKYKCPKCLIPYCSLPCFKKHKEIPCDKPVTPSEPKQVDVEPPAHVEPLAQVERPYYVDEQELILRKEQLDILASSDEIREALKNEELQKLIYNIDCSENAESELDKAMEIETFRVFTDKILSTINPR